MWANIVSIVIGLWLMISPAIFGMDAATADNNHIVGPLAITFSVIALWEINKKLLRVNAICGAWLLASFLIFPFASTAVIISNTACAILLILLGFVKRKTQAQYGGGWSSLFQKYPEHLRAAEKKSFGA